MAGQRPQQTPNGLLLGWATQRRPSSLPTTHNPQPTPTPPHPHTHTPTYPHTHTHPHTHNRQPTGHWPLLTTHSNHNPQHPQHTIRYPHQVDTGSPGCSARLSCTQTCARHTGAPGCIDDTVHGRHRRGVGQQSTQAAWTTQTGSGSAVQVEPPRMTGCSHVPWVTGQSTVRQRRSHGPVASGKEGGWHGAPQACVA